MISRSDPLILGPVLYHPTILSRAAHPHSHDVTFFFCVSRWYRARCLAMFHKTCPCDPWITCWAWFQAVTPLQLIYFLAAHPRSARPGTKPLFTAHRTRTDLTFLARAGTVFLAAFSSTKSVSAAHFLKQLHLALFEDHQDSQGDRNPSKRSRRFSDRK